ncbi:MAG: AI-2E family transporter, partial [Gammaproteobacteria bacterium]
MPASTWLLAGLFALAVGYTLYFAAGLLKPIALAGFLTLVLSPAKRALTRFGIPPLASAGLLVVTVTGIILVLISLLALPAGEWIEEAPQNIRELQRELRAPGGSIGNIRELAEEVDELADVDNGSAAPQAVVVEQPGMMKRMV